MLGTRSRRVLESIFDQRLVGSNGSRTSIAVNAAADAANAAPPNTSARCHRPATACDTQGAAANPASTVVTPARCDCRSSSRAMSRLPTTSGTNAVIAPSSGDASRWPSAVTRGGASSAWADVGVALVTASAARAHPAASACRRPRRHPRRGPSARRRARRQLRRRRRNQSRRRPRSQPRRLPGGRPRRIENRPTKCGRR